MSKKATPAVKAAESKTTQSVKTMVVSTSELAALLGITPQWIRRLTEMGHFEKQGRGQYLLGDAVKGYSKYMKIKLEEATKAASANRARDARTELAELTISERRRQLIPLEDATQAMDFMCGTVKSQMNGIGARCTRDKVLKRKIEDEIDKAFTLVAKALAKTAGTLRKGGDVLDTVS